jgi:hypothetical protein
MVLLRPYSWPRLTRNGQDAWIAVGAQRCIPLPLQALTALRSTYSVNDLRRREGAALLRFTEAHDGTAAPLQLASVDEGLPGCTDRRRGTAAHTATLGSPRQRCALLGDEEWV